MSVDTIILSHPDFTGASQNENVGSIPLKRMRKSLEKGKIYLRVFHKMTIYMILLQGKISWILDSLSSQFSWIKSHVY